MKNSNQLQQQKKPTEKEVLVLLICKDCNKKTQIQKGRRVCKKCILKRKKDKKIDATCSICFKTKNIGYYSFTKNKKANTNYICNRCLSSIKNSGNKSLLSKYNYNEDLFATIDNELKAYLLGIIAGDGNLYKTTVYLCAHKNDVETLDLFRSNVCKDLNIKTKQNTNVKYIRSYSKKISKDLSNHLMISPGKKSNLIKMPQINETLKKDFIRGLFDTDGWISKINTKSSTPACGIGLTSYEMILEIKKICENKNIKFSYTIRQPKKHTHLPLYLLKFSGFNALNFLSYIYLDSKYKLSRKYNLYNIWSKWKPGVGIKDNLTKLEIKIKKQIPIGKAKLSSNEVRKIRSLYKTGLSYDKISKQFNVHKNSIRKIIKGITFKHIK